MALFPRETLAKLKTEHGGIQTLLKNHHQIFLGKHLLTNLTRTLILIFIINAFLMQPHFILNFALFYFCLCFCLRLANDSPDIVLFTFQTWHSVSVSLFT